MSAFQEEWVKFDPLAKQFIAAVELPVILRKLPQNLCELTPDSSKVEVMRMLANFPINVNEEGQIHFAETFIAILQYYPRVSTPSSCLRV